MLSACKPGLMTSALYPPPAGHPIRHNLPSTREKRRGAGGRERWGTPCKDVMWCCRWLLMKRKTFERALSHQMNNLWVKSASRCTPSDCDWSTSAACHARSLGIVAVCTTTISYMHLIALGYVIFAFASNLHTRNVAAWLRMVLHWCIDLKK